MTKKRLTVEYIEAKAAGLSEKLNCKIVSHFYFGSDTDGELIEGYFKMPEDDILLDAEIYLQLTSDQGREQILRKLLLIEESDKRILDKMNYPELYMEVSREASNLFYMAYEDKLRKL